MPICLSSIRDMFAIKNDIMGETFIFWQISPCYLLTTPKLALNSIYNILANALFCRIKFGGLHQRQKVSESNNIYKFLNAQYYVLYAHH